MGTTGPEGDKIPEKKPDRTPEYMYIYICSPRHTRFGRARAWVAGAAIALSLLDSLDRVLPFHSVYCVAAGRTFDLKSFALGLAVGVLVHPAAELLIFYRLYTIQVPSQRLTAVQG